MEPNRLGEMRKLKGITQEKMAEDLNISYSTLQKWEQGLNQMNGKNLKTLSAYLKCSVDEILGIQTVGSLDASLSFEQIRLLKIYEKLSPSGRSKWVEYGELLSDAEFRRFGNAGREDSGVQEARSA